MLFIVESMVSPKTTVLACLFLLLLLAVVLKPVFDSQGVHSWKSKHLGVQELFFRVIYTIRKAICRTTAR